MVSLCLDISEYLFKWTIFGVQLTIVANSSLWQSGAALNCHKIQMAEHFSIAAIVAAIAAFHVL